MIRLGKMSMKDAEAIKTKVEALGRIQAAQNPAH